MSWKEEFVAQLGSRGFSASEFDLPDAPAAVHEALAEVEQWWERLDTQTKSVLRNSGAGVADGLSSTGFAGRWPQLVALLAHGSTDEVLPTAFNKVVDAWATFRDGVNLDEHMNDTDYDDYEAVRNTTVQALSEN